MKFTDKEVFEKLKDFLTNNGKKTLRMSEKSIQKQLETLMPIVANDEMELSDFFEKVKGAFEVMNSNAEKDYSDFIKQWEKNHQPPQPPTPPVNEPPKPDDEVSKLMRRLEELEKKDKEREREAAISQKKTELLKAMKSKGIKDEQWSKDFIKEISITDDFDVDAKAEAYLKIYNKSKASGVTTNANPTVASDRQIENDPLAGVRALFKKKELERERMLNNK